MNVEIIPLDEERWSVFESFFEDRGAPHYCWCMAWRVNEFKTNISGKAGKKAAFRHRVKETIPVGLIAMVREKVVAWCSVGPRESFRPLGGDENLDGVWSIVCFYIHRNFRGKGINRQLIEMAKTYARTRGANYLEAYPVAPDSPSYRFMGTCPLFEQSGFKFVRKIGIRRNLMIIKL